MPDYLSRAQVRLALAEHLSVPCPECHGAGYGIVETFAIECGGCSGAGRLWSLRESCTHRGDYVNPKMDKCTQPGCCGWMLKEMHLEDILLYLWAGEDPYGGDSLRTLYEAKTPADLLDRAERRLLAKLEERPAGRT